ncbi:DMT family transporter [Shouchella clausii]|uniref:EamA family transporter n=1 Tax=Shouchella clausii TaxID=79880 RepID=UPI000BA63069|nr:DMT family transporter [Shouchella clausii]PAD91373.1 EamA family transporter [Shouchella clausii]
MRRYVGLMLVLAGALCWGMGGTVAQKLFQQDAVNINWLVSIRLLIAGAMLLIIQLLLKNRSQILDVWKTKQSAARLLTFGIFGMLAVQYTYMASIKNGNSAVATLLQYLAPVMIILYMVVRGQNRLTRRDLIYVSLALSGCYFLLTNGSLSELSVPASAIIWGILSGAALAFYTLYAVPLLKQYDSLVIVGWAMIIGGMALSVIHPPWRIEEATFQLETYLHLGFVIFFGTMLAFWFYIESLNTLSPKETSLLGSAEPLAAVVTMVIWLREPFGVFQWGGLACILAMIFIMASQKEDAEAQA